MSHEEQLLAGAALACGDTVLVPVLRLCARGIGPWASLDVEFVGAVLSTPAGAASFLATEPSPADATSWSAWLDARPALLQEIRARLADAGRAR